MGYIELYNKDVLDLIAIGKATHNFQQKMGDYIKVEIINVDNDPIGTLYSNRLLLREPDGNNFYLGSYHYHTEDKSMGFCSGKEHTKKSVSKLQPISSTNIGDENSKIQYKKQVDIFRDNENRIYIKPNELIKLFVLKKVNIKLEFIF